jgi:hypothetical protein
MSNTEKRLAATATRKVGSLILKYNNIIFSSGLTEVVENILRVIPTTYIDGVKILVQYSGELSVICVSHKEDWLSCFSDCI